MSRRSTTYHSGNTNLRVFREALKHELLQLQSRGTRSKTRFIAKAMSWSTIADHPDTTNLRVFHKALKHDPLQMQCHGYPSLIIRVYHPGIPRSTKTRTIANAMPRNTL